jgi:undecaprenyl diphosphate synthase
MSRLVSQPAAAHKSAELTLPTHVGIIPDGNRRWARAKGVPTFEGHRRGVEVFREISLAGFERGVKYITFYAFSTENWNRTQQEVGYLMKLFQQLATKDVHEMHNRNVRVRFLGSREGMSASLLKAMAAAEELTAGNTAGNVSFCLNYGGQQEIAEATARMIADGVKPEEVTPELMGKYLYAPDLPPVDLVIRTSGERRMSGFMMWETAYAEVSFFDMNFPDFTAAELDVALADYSQRQRRFGA